MSTFWEVSPLYCLIFVNGITLGQEFGSLNVNSLTSLPLFSRSGSTWAHTLKTYIWKSLLFSLGLPLLSLLESTSSFQPARINLSLRYESSSQDLKPTSNSLSLEHQPLKLSLSLSRCDRFKIDSPAFLLQFFYHRTKTSLMILTPPSSTLDSMP